MVSAVKFLGIFFVTQIPIAIAEGLLTTIIYNFISENEDKRGTCIMTTHESKKKGNSTKLTVILMLLVLAIVIVPQVTKKWGRIWWSQMTKLNLL